MNFKEFVTTPPKSMGYIGLDGKIHYDRWCPPKVLIRFRRVNLEGSNRNSFWNVEVPNLGDDVREALRYWALNMPEHYTDNVVFHRGISSYSSTVEKVANFNFSVDKKLTEAHLPIVSFDFDGVLHIDMVPGTIHPAIWEHGNLRPRVEYIQKLKKEAQANRIIIVSSRCEESRPEIEEFIDINSLPVEGVHLTCMRPKVPLLMKLGAIRHYDDNAYDIQNEMKRYGATFEFVAVPMCTEEDVA